MPTLEWIGKEKVINHHQEVPFRVLDRQYSFDENGQHAGEKVNCAEGAREAALGRNGSENMIIHGDNLDALKALLPRYEGRVKCIYIDPPYNTGNEGWVYNVYIADSSCKCAWPVFVLPNYFVNKIGIADNIWWHQKSRPLLAVNILFRYRQC